MNVNKPLVGTNACSDNLHTCKTGVWDSVDFSGILLLKDLKRKGLMLSGLGLKAEWKLFSAKRHRTIAQQCYWRIFYEKDKDVKPQMTRNSRADQEMRFFHSVFTMYEIIHIFALASRSLPMEWIFFQRIPKNANFVIWQLTTLSLTKQNNNKDWEHVEQIAQ